MTTRIRTESRYCPTCRGKTTHKVTVTGDGTPFYRCLVCQRERFARVHEPGQAVASLAEIHDYLTQFEAGTRWGHYCPSVQPDEPPAERLTPTTEVMFVNLTPHEIRVRRDGQDDLIIPPSGSVARCAADQKPTGQINGVVLVRTVFSDIHGLPSVEDTPPGTVYIVSSQVAQAAASRQDVVAPDTGPTAVRDGAGQIVAVTRFQRF